MGKVILIASGKGGTGKTVFTSNAGVILAQKGFNVLLLDMDMGLRNLDICLGVENRVIYDVSDVLTGLCRIKQALIKDKRFPNLCLMASPPHKDDGEITPLHMKVLCKKLKNKFDYILIDGPAGIDDSLSLAAAGADSVVIVTMPEFAALRDADMLDRTLLDLGMKERMYVVNKVRAELMDSGFVPGFNQIAQMLRPEMAGIIQYDDNIHIAANNGLPIVCKTNTYIYENFCKIVERIIR